MLHRSAQRAKDQLNESVQAMLKLIEDQRKEIEKTIDVAYSNKQVRSFHTQMLLIITICNVFAAVLPLVNLIC